MRLEPSAVKVARWVLRGRWRSNAPPLPDIESLFKTMKYHVTYPNAFDTLEDARRWMGDFVHWYNTEHLHSSIGYVTPHQMRHGQAESIFELRNEAINQARQLHPERWGSRSAKQWIVNREVVLNPDKK
ncbi:integrase core domain-containing protein [Prosthecochloris aestuarii]|nr:integrase core domain-containing protein [Prosthecochloris aestuarii]